MYKKEMHKQQRKEEVRVSQREVLMAWLSEAGHGMQRIT